MPRSEEMYRRLVAAVQRGDLAEPFSKADFQRACPGLSDATYRAFLWRHSGGDVRSKNSPLLERVEPIGFRLTRPFRLGL
jgi:hypothetical protein